MTGLYNGAPGWFNPGRGVDRVCISGCSMAQRIGDVEPLEKKQYFPWVEEWGRANHELFYNWLLELSPLTHGHTIEKISLRNSKAEFLAAE